MANEIDLVVGTAVSTQLEKLMKELVAIDLQITKIGETAEKMNSVLGVKSTADLAKLTAENEKLNKKIQDLTGSTTVLETKLANLAAAQSRAAKAATDASIADEKLLAVTNKNTVATEKRTKATLEETIAQREATNQATLRIKAGEGEAKTYAELDARHKQAVKTAQDLAVSTGRTGKAYEDAKFKANELGKQLKVIDTDIGKHTRNVGNYSSSWNGLGNSINQLTREAPAFANSVQTGFMALSNNIPILTDELGVLIQKNKDLQKDGKPTESILKTVAGAFFSWQTAISLGVTILTVYGAKIWDMVSGLDALKKKQEAFALSQKLMDNSIENTTKNIIARTELLVNESKLRGESADKQRAIILQGEKDIQANLVLRRDSDKKKYENGKYYAELEAKESALFYKGSSREVIRERQRLANELKKYKNWETTPEALADMKNAAILSENAVKEQGRKITLLKSGQKLEEYNEAKKAQDKIDKLADKPEKKVLKFDEVKSVHDLAEAKIEGQKIDLQSADLDKMTTEQKIENRTKLTEFELLKIFEVASEEKAIADKKRDDDKVENDRALKNQTISREQYNKNIEDIDKTHKTVLEKINVEEINKEKVLLTSQEKYIEDLREKDLKSSQELSIKKLDAEILADKMIYEDKEKGKKQTLKDREAAFQEFLLDSEKRIAIQEKIAMTEAGADPIKQEAVRENFKALRLELTKIISPAEQAKEAIDGFFKDSYDKAMTGSLERLGMQSLKTFLDFDKNGQSSFMKMMGNTDDLAEKSAIAFQAVGDAAQQAFGLMQQSSDAHYQAEYAKLDEQKRVALENAGDSASAKEKIEKDYAAKKKELELKQFRQKQKMAVANIAIDTAQAIMQIWAHSPDPTGISQGTMSIIIGALGAIETAMVLTQKPPAYAEGTDNHSGGLMLVNDGKGANYEEKVILPSGKVIRPQGRNVLMNAPKGTKVLNHEQQLFEMLQSNNISIPSNSYQGMTSEEMDEILGKHFGNIKTQNTIFDKNGFQSYVRNGNSITRSNSNRSQAIGISV